MEKNIKREACQMCPCKRTSTGSYLGDTQLYLSSSPDGVPNHLRSRTGVQGPTLGSRPRLSFATLSFVHRGDRTSPKPMELIAENRHTTWVIRPDLATALTNPDRTLHRAASYIGAKLGLYETAFERTRR